MLHLWGDPSGCLQLFRAVREMEGGKEGVMAQGSLAKRGLTRLFFLEKPKSESKEYSKRKTPRQLSSFLLCSP